MVKPSSFKPLVVELSSDSDDEPIFIASTKPATKRPATTAAATVKLPKENIPPHSNAAVSAAASSYDSDASSNYDRDVSSNYDSDVDNKKLPALAWHKKPKKQTGLRLSFSFAVVRNNEAQNNDIELSDNCKSDNILVERNDIIELLSSDDESSDNILESDNILDRQNDIIELLSSDDESSTESSNELLLSDDESSSESDESSTESSEPVAAKAAGKRKAASSTAIVPYVGIGTEAPKPADVTSESFVLGAFLFFFLLLLTRIFTDLFFVQFCESGRKSMQWTLWDVEDSDRLQV